MLDIRQGLAKTSTEKYNAMLRTVCPDGRIRGLTQFCGAARTGRWAGRLVQMQNLPQNKMPDSELDAARRLVREGDLETLEMLFDDTAGTLRLIPSMNARRPALTQSASIGVNAAARKSRGTGNLFLFGGFAY